MIDRFVQIDQEKKLALNLFIKTSKEGQIYHQIATALFAINIWKKKEKTSET